LISQASQTSMIATQSAMTGSRRRNAIDSVGSNSAPGSKLSPFENRARPRGYCGGVERPAAACSRAVCARSSDVRWRRLTALRGLSRSSRSRALGERLPDLLASEAEVA
jgi:hypothetical protein